MVEKGESKTFAWKIIDRKRRLWYNDSGLGRFRGERSFFVPAQKEMTLGDSVNNRQGSFLFSFGI
mgnify:CR=1 FL=1